MEARGRRNLKNYRKEASASASAEGGDHDHDLTKRNDKKDQILATKPTAEEEVAAQPAGKEEKKEKRKRVVRDRKAQGLIDFMIVHSTSVHEIPDEWLARCSEKDRVKCAKTKAHSEKMQADEQALIDQYLINGYAESFWEATDDEDEDDDDDGDNYTAEIDHGSKEG